MSARSDTVRSSMQTARFHGVKSLKDTTVKRALAVPCSVQTADFACCVQSRFTKDQLAASFQW